MNAPEIATWNLFIATGDSQLEAIQIPQIGINDGRLSSPQSGNSALGPYYYMNDNERRQNGNSGKYFVNSEKKVNIACVFDSLRR